MTTYKTDLERISAEIRARIGKLREDLNVADAIRLTSEQKCKALRDETDRLLSAARSIDAAIDEFEGER